MSGQTKMPPEILKQVNEKIRELNTLLSFYYVEDVNLFKDFKEELNKLHTKVNQLELF